MLFVLWFARSHVFFFVRFNYFFCSGAAFVCVLVCLCAAHDYNAQRVPNTTGTTGTVHLLAIPSFLSVYSVYLCTNAVLSSLFFYFFLFFYLLICLFV
jgi:hypothetical protein